MGSLITWQMLRMLRLPTKAGFAILGIHSKVSLLAVLPTIGWIV
jgi:hypothetical protein